MDNLINENLFKFIAYTIPIVSSIFGAIKGVKSIKESSSKQKIKERENLVKIIQEVELLKIDENFKKSIIDEYKRFVVKAIKGIDIAPDKYKAIIDSGLLNKYSNSQIKISNRFFEYPENGISVKIPWIETVVAIFYSVFALILIVLGSAILLVAMNNAQEIWRYLVLIGFSILTTAFGFYTISVFVAPVNVARIIKKGMVKK